MEQPPNALFDSYEQEFNQISGSIREKLKLGDEQEARGGEPALPFAMVLNTDS